MAQTSWPDLHHPEWGATRDTLHMWTQVVGKVNLALSPFLNQWWEVAFSLTARGVATGLIPTGDRSFAVEFDFVEHQLSIDVSDGRHAVLPLQPRSVADFHAAFSAQLSALGVKVSPSPGPSEVAERVPFAEQTNPGTYNRDAVTAWWRAMLSVERVVQRFRTPFHGKSSPVNFFWGGFDLNHSRFNGKPNSAMNPTSGPIMRYGENEENFATGFWPGMGPDPSAFLYAYITPAPAGVDGIATELGTWSEEMSEFVLAYDELRVQPDPDAALLRFFQNVYEASAALAGWDRGALEGEVPAGFAS